MWDLMDQALYESILYILEVISLHCISHERFDSMITPANFKSYTFDIDGMPTKKFDNFHWDMLLFPLKKCI